MYTKTKVLLLRNRRCMSILTFTHEITFSMWILLIFRIILKKNETFDKTIKKGGIGILRENHRPDASY
jgi:hypothetical protein